MIFNRDASWDGSHASPDPQNDPLSRGLVHHATSTNAPARIERALLRRRWQPAPRQHHAIAAWETWS